MSLSQITNPNGIQVENLYDEDNVTLGVAKIIAALRINMKVPEGTNVVPTSYEVLCAKDIIAYLKSAL